MALMQLMLLPEYRKLPFTQMFWVFTFPVAATANYSIRWLATTDLPGREIYAWTILSLATAFTLAIAARTAPQPSPQNRRDKPQHRAQKCAEAPANTYLSCIV